MKIAIDNIDYIDKLKGKELIYIFDKEPINKLINTNLHCVHKEYIEEVDINLTNYDIECKKKCCIDDDLTIEKKDYKIAIIVPNYNYEEWIDKCLSSIAKQTYKNYEVIFVDDMSTDNSINIAYKYVEKLSNIKIIQLKQKRLNGGARNEAYLHLSDDVDYIMYVDSDDWLIDGNVLEQINNKLQTRPDVLFIGMADYKNGIEKECFIPKYKDKYEAIKGWSGSCGKVIKRALATRQECLYNEGTLKEDKNQHCKICIHMKLFANLKKPVYVWNKENRKSVTTVREKIIWGTSTIRHYADTLQLYLSEKGKDPKIDTILEERLRLAKSEMENGGDKQY